MMESCNVSRFAYRLLGVHCLRDRRYVFGFMAIPALILSACMGRQATPFRPPTVAPQPAFQPLPGPTFSPTVTEPPLPTVTPACVNGLTFLEDLTIPDGTVVQPGEVLEKSWLVENSGTCNWNKDYRVRLISGPGMGASEEQALFPARASAQAIIRILFTAPAEPGLYQSAWQAHDPLGKPFGDPFFIQILVGGASPTP